MLKGGKALEGIRSDYAFSLVASFSAVVSSTVLFGWVGRTMGPDELGLFSQVRRVSAMWVSIGSLGVSMALSRYIPRLTDLQLIRRRSLQTIALVVGMLSLHGIVVNVPRGALLLTPVIGDRLELVWPLLLQICGLCILVLPYAILRGLNQIRLSALLQIVGYGVWPLVAMWFSSTAGLPSLIATIAMGQLILGCVVAAGVLAFVAPLRMPTHCEPDPGLKSWVAYGMARLPGGLTQFIMWAGIPMILVHSAQTTEVALANAVTSLVNLPVMILSPLSFVLLPRLSLAQVEGEEQEVWGFLQQGLRIAWELQLPATFSLVLFLGWVLEIWLGFSASSFLEAGRWMIMSMPALTLFMFLRPAMDARTLVPYPMLAQGLGLVVGSAWFLCCYDGHNTVELGKAFFMAQTVAGIASGFWCSRLHKMPVEIPLKRLFVQALPLGVGGAVVLSWGPGLGAVALWGLTVLGYLLVLKFTDSPVWKLVLSNEKASFS